MLRLMFYTFRVDSWRQATIVHIAVVGRIASGMNAHLPRQPRQTIRSTWLKNNVLLALKEVWLEEYKGKSLGSPISTTHYQRSRSPKRYTSCREHKRLKLNPNPEPVGCRFWTGRA